MTYTAEQKAKALQTLDGMEKMIEHETLTHAGYLGACDPELKERLPLCRGHNACMIGSLYLAHGVRRQRDLLNNYALPGVEPNEQEAFVAKRPALKLAYDALDEAARRLVKRHPEWADVGQDGGAPNAAENLFEAGGEFGGHAVNYRFMRNAKNSNPIAYGDKKARKRLVDSARRIVEKA